MPEPGPFSNKLSFFMEKAGVNDPQLAGAVGASKQQIFNLRHGARKLTVEWAKRLAPHLGISWETLVTGVEPRPTVPRPNAEAHHAVVVPELDVRAMGGSGALDDPLDGSGHHVVLAEWRLPESYLRSFTPSPGEVRIIRVVGDSMEPHYPAGDRVLVDTSHRIPSPPGVYVLWDGFALILKHVEVLAGRRPPVARLSSDNPAYAPYEVPVGDLTVQGRVMGKWVWK